MNNAAIHQGIAGVASWLIGALLIVAGLGLWFQPQQHTFYGIVARTGRTRPARSRRAPPACPGRRR